MIKAPTLSPNISPTDVSAEPTPVVARPASGEGYFDQAYKIASPGKPEVGATPVVEKREPRPNRRQTFEISISESPVPRSLRSLMAGPAEARDRALSLNTLSIALPTPGAAAITPPACRAPSPLPTPLKGAVPSEMQEMDSRLAELVAQSNEYVRGLAERIAILERQRLSLTGAASVEALAVFIETRPRFAGLDVERIATFQLPLHVWQHLATTIMEEHADDARGLENILYWRGRAEAEAMGLLVSDHRSSLGSYDSSGYGPSPRASLSDSRRPSTDASLYPRRPSARSTRSFTSVVSKSPSPSVSPAPKEAD